MSAVIRTANIKDVDAIHNILTRSLRETCAPDYGNDKEVIELWCLQRTKNHISQWIDDQENFFIVALDASEAVVGAGLLQNPNRVKLCYVLPDALYNGIGKLLMGEMEERAIFLGSKECILSSTITAKTFYEKQGYISDSEGLALGKIPFITMRKQLK